MPRYYQYSTLEIKDLLNASSKLRTAFRFRNWLLKQIPGLTNYSYDPEWLSIDEIFGKGVWYPSETNLDLHVQLSGLSHNCYLMLNSAQHKHIRKLAKQVHDADIPCLLH